MDRLLSALTQVQGVVRSSSAGEVLETAGAFDVDTLAAVAAVSEPALRQIGAVLAAGRLERWFLVTEQHTYYGSERPSERLLGLGEPVRNPDATSKRLHEAQ